MQTQLIQEKNISLIRQMLNNGETVTVLSIFKKVGTIDGRKYISILKDEGMPISSKWIVTQNGKHIKEHKLIK